MGARPTPNAGSGDPAYSPAPVGRVPSRGAGDDTRIALGARHVIDDSSRGADGVRLGDLDVITCEERDNLGVVWYENPARASRP